MNHLHKTLLIAGVAAVLSAGYMMSATNESSTGTVSTTGASLSPEVRTELYKTAMQNAAATSDWPKTEHALIYEFWRAISAKDWDTVLMLCPGSSKEDFIMYDKWTPQPAEAVGRPEPHPTNAAKMIYPVRVDFPGFPDKTIKMGIMTLPNGRLAIDAQHTIWW